jgi:hypothetical protein
MEPAAVIIVLVGATIGKLLAAAPPASGAVRWAGITAAAVLVATLVPTAIDRVRVAHGEIVKRHRVGIKIDRLQAVVDRIGGATLIKNCGQPVTLVGFQSTLAWMVDLNVGNVGFHPGKAIDKGDPIVVFKPHLQGWQVRPYHTSSRCDRLRTDTAFG